ncbi:hypothetical protein UP09_33460 [Bradyrhizobium sp. LTSP885]|uniref:hypothetical protein n=1 Tax=Bradyrhizobium sp. LTSP885 TaxID=1619232 RepID=UPI0005CB2EF2|nr:hypothetical protein [Bradyrhizobium sp. LTSP885]KJC36050.1 hypothetical protein UP09_33460 [Bradyrhizobium sp. LTSP885]
MKRGFLAAKFVAAFFVAISLCAAPARSNPGCSLSDIGQAAKDTFNNIPLSCSPQVADPAFYPVLAYVIALLQAPQGNDFCNAAEQANASASKVGTILKNLPGGDSPALSPVIDELNSDSAAASSALDVVVCACKTAEWKGPGALGGDFVSCVTDALCSVDDWLHDNVWSGFSDCGSDTPPTQPALINCRPDPKYQDASGYWDWDWSKPFVGNANNCDAGPGFGADNGYNCQGSFCISATTPGYSGGNSNYCFCPPVMQTWDQYGDDNGNCIGYLSCHCPDGSQALSDSGAGAYICMCPSGSPVSADKTCPPPPPKCEPSCPAGLLSTISNQQTCSYSCDCPAGLTKVGDVCVTPCTDASQVMLAGGACCAASQSTSCGTCCPDGMKPDAHGDSCVSATPPVNKIPAPAQAPKKT